jgi:hypothetical protein
MLKHGQSLGAFEWLIAISCLYLVFFVYVRATGNRP